MMRVSSIKSITLAMLLISTLMGCGAAKDSESLQPLYGTEKLRLSDSKITVEYWGDVGSTKIEPSGFRRLTRAFFGWIPVVGSLMEIPLDILTTVLPPLPSSSFPDLPQDAAWNDPRVLNAVSSLKLTDGYVRIIPKNERGLDYKDRCFMGMGSCAEEDLDFISEIKIYVIFTDPRFGQGYDADHRLNKQEILLAEAKTKNDYDRENKVLHFVAKKINLRPLLIGYGKFDVKVVATGKFPKNTVYLDGRLRVEADLNLSE
jgi:hypothetical protein